MSKFYNATSLVFITVAVDSSRAGTAIIEIGGVKRGVKLHHDYSIEYNGIKVFRNGLYVFTCDNKAKDLSEIVLAVQICLVIKENM